MSSNSRNSSKNDRVAQALGIYQSIAACNERLARGNDVHALTAALMLPCYKAEFMRVVLELGPEEENELGTALQENGRPPHSTKSSAGHSSDARTAWMNSAASCPSTTR
jgi:hypothetical protein